MEVNKNVWINSYDKATIDSYQTEGKLAYYIFFEIVGISRAIKSFDFETEAEARSFMFKVNKNLKSGILKDILEELKLFKKGR